MPKELLSIMGACGFVLLCLFLVERRKLSAREIALLSALAALGALGRVGFAALPGIQPATFIVILSGLVFGCTGGFSVGVLIALVSNVFLGHGPWTLFQMFGWGLCGVSAGALGNVRFVENRVALILLGVFWGYLFGWIMNSWYWYSFVYPLTLKSWLLANASSFWFDSMHAVGNGLLFYFFGRDAVKILRRFDGKLSFVRKKLVPASV